MYDDALKMYNKSYLCDSILNDTINMLFGMRDIASVYNFKKNYTQCLRILGKAYLISKKIDNKLLKSSITHSLAVCYNDIGDDKSSKSFLYMTLNNLPTSIESSVYGLAADIYMKEGKMDSVFYYSNLLMNNNDIFGKQKASKYLCQYYISKNKNVLALSFNNKYRMFTDSINEINAVETVAKMNAIYNFSLKEKEKMQLQVEVKEKTYLFIVCFSIVLFGMTFFIFLNEKNKKKYLQFRFLSESLKNLQKENTAHSDDKSTDRQSVFCGEENRNTYIGAIIELIQNRIEEKKN